MVILIVLVFSKRSILGTSFSAQVAIVNLGLGSFLLFSPIIKIIQFSAQVVVVSLGLGSFLLSILFPSFIKIMIITVLGSGGRCQLGLVRAG